MADKMTDVYIPVVINTGAMFVYIWLNGVYVYVNSPGHSPGEGGNLISSFHWINQFHWISLT